GQTARRERERDDGGSASDNASVLSLGPSRHGVAIDRRGREHRPPAALLTLRRSLTEWGGAGSLPWPRTRCGDRPHSTRRPLLRACAGAVYFTGLVRPGEPEETRAAAAGLQPLLLRPEQSLGFPRPQRDVHFRRAGGHRHRGRGRVGGGLRRRI